MTLNERHQLVKPLLGKIVNIKIDRPIGYVHKNITYPINYGYIPNTCSGDGEELDVYLLGVNVPLQEYKAQIIGIVYRRNDIEDKLIAVPVGKIFSKKEIEKEIDFQEKYFDSYIELIDKTLEKNT